ncbi:hypothetical protein RFI_02422, partial [Reticulomyxa filosa]
ALKLYLEIFGRNHADVAESYNNLGCAYDDKGQYDEAVECYEMSLKIRKEIFGIMNKSVGDSYWNLGLVFEKKNETKTSCKYFEEVWKIYNVVLGQWDEQTLRAKQRVKELTELHEE